MGAGFVVYTASYHLTHREGAAFGVVLALGGGKEAYDLFSSRGHPEVADFLWTVAGGVVGLLVVKGSLSHVQ